MLFKRETMYIPVMPYDIIPYIEVNTGSPIFIPRKHIYATPAMQRRAAKKRRRRRS
jgi:hypothetical protein